MKKKNVVRKNHEFEEIINSAENVFSDFLVIYFKDNDEWLKVGISISKKFANAVKRNRYRRQVRAIFDNLNLYEAKKTIIIILRKPFLPLSFKNKMQEVKELLKKVL